MIERILSKPVEINLAKWKAFGDKYCDDGNYVIDDTNRFAIINCLKWLQGEPFEQYTIGDGGKKKGNPNKGLYIGGKCGRGKSIFVKILRDYAQDLGVSFKIKDKQIKANWVPQNATTFTDRYMNGDTLSDEKERAILNIEDLGIEPISSQYMGNKSEVLKNLIEYRADTDNITIITSNIRPDILKDRYGQRVVSRCKALNYMVINGEDRRES